MQILRKLQIWRGLQICSLEAGNFFRIHKKLSKKKYVSSYRKNNSYGKSHKEQRLRKNNKSSEINKKCTVISINAASLKSKLLSFENLILKYKPAIFGIKESQMSKLGQIKFQNSDEYQIYELFRKK